MRKYLLIWITYTNFFFVEICASQRDTGTNAAQLLKEFEELKGTEMTVGRFIWKCSTIASLKHIDDAFMRTLPKCKLTTGGIIDFRRFKTPRRDTSWQHLLLALLEDFEDMDPNYFKQTINL